MQKTENTKPKKRTWILETVVILIFVAVVLAIAHPIYLTYKVTRRMKAETMAPLIDEIYRFHQEENRWPDEEQFQTLAHRLDIDIKKENLAISANPENLYMIGRLGGKRYIYYHFITQEKRDSGNRLGWWFCHEGTHYSYEPEDWPVLKNAPEP